MSFLLFFLMQMKEIELHNVLSRNKSQHILNLYGTLYNVIIKYPYHSLRLTPLIYYTNMNKSLYSGTYPIPNERNNVQ